MPPSLRLLASRLKDEMIGYIVNGLDKTYNSLMLSVENPATTITLDDLFGMVSSHDMR
jgi:hypothetical protein